MLKLKNHLIIFFIIISIFLNIILIIYILKNNSKSLVNSNNKNPKTIIYSNNYNIYQNVYQNDINKTNNLNEASKKIYENQNTNQNQSIDKNTTNQNKKTEYKNQIIKEFYSLLEKNNRNKKIKNNINNYNIAFVIDENGYGQIVLGYLDKYNYKLNIYKKLNMEYSDSAYPCFSNKGDKLAFVSNKDGNYNLYIYDIKNNNIEKITNFYNEDDRYNYNPKWDFYDQRIFFINIKDDYTYLKYAKKIIDKKPVLKFIDLKTKEVHELLEGVLSFYFIDYNTLLVSYTKIFNYNFSYYYDNFYGIYKVFINGNNADVINPSVENDVITSTIAVNPTKTMFAYPQEDKIIISSIDIIKDEKTHSYMRIKKEIPIILNKIESMDFIDSENIILSCKNSGNYDLYLLNIETFKLIKITDTIYNENSISFKPY